MCSYEGREHLSSPLSSRAKSRAVLIFARFSRGAGRTRGLSLRCNTSSGPPISLSPAKTLPSQNAKLAQLTHGRNRHLFNRRRGGFHALGGGLLSPSAARRYSRRHVSGRRTSRRRAA